LNASHHGLEYETQYNLHNLNGLVQTEHTYAFLIGNKDYPNMDNRPFILTRSTFPGSGRFSSHWLGDNYRTWDHLKYSVAGIMNMAMFGIPHTGADVCGFYGEKLD
jgi:alpha-glucosidase